MTVTFKCGHRQDVPSDVQAPPTCSACGERVVARVEKATPRFTGTCTGPLVSK